MVSRCFRGGYGIAYTVGSGELINKAKWSLGQFTYRPEPYDIRLPTAEGLLVGRVSPELECLDPDSDGRMLMVHVCAILPPDVNQRLEAEVTSRLAQMPLPSRPGEHADVVVVVRNPWSVKVWPSTSEGDIGSQFHDTGGFLSLLGLRTAADPASILEQCRTLERSLHGALRSNVHALRQLCDPACTFSDASGLRLAADNRLDVARIQHHGIDVDSYSGAFCVHIIGRSVLLAGIQVVGGDGPRLLHRYRSAAKPARLLLDSSLLGTMAASSLLEPGPHRA